MRILLTADWTHLAVVTFQAEEKLLAPYLPYKTELNDWNGNYYFSLVGFLFSNPVIAGIPAPFYRSFEEMNLRFYIRYKTKGHWEKAVVFIREITPSPIIGLAAKYLYRESFISLPMKHQYNAGDDTWQTEYYWQIQHQWNYLKLITGSHPAEPADDSLEAFIRNHYRACTMHGPAKTKEFIIEHPHWHIYPGLSCDISINPEKIYGREFISCFRQKPGAFFLMDGSRTKVSYPSLL